MRSLPFLILTGSSFPIDNCSPSSARRCCPSCFAPFRCPTVCVALRDAERTLSLIPCSLLLLVVVLFVASLSILLFVAWSWFFLRLRHLIAGRSRLCHWRRQCWRRIEHADICSPSSELSWARTWASPLRTVGSNDKAGVVGKPLQSEPHGVGHASV